MQRILFLLTSMVLFLLVFAGIAQADILGHKEAEELPSTTFGAQFTDPNGTPSGATPNAWRFTANGTNTHSMTLREGDTVDSVVVRGRIRDNTTTTVEVTLVVDGVDKATKTLKPVAAGKTFAERTWSQTITGAGNHTLAIRTSAIDAQADGFVYDWIEARGTYIPPDTDGDGVLDANDNCTSVPNPDQADQDGDSVGDVCDPDRDGDGVDNLTDNCPLIANPGQRDTDNDGVGDTCDSTPGACSPEANPSIPVVYAGSGAELESVTATADTDGVAKRYCATFTGSYDLQNKLAIGPGDELYGVVGTTTKVGKATDPDAPTHLTNGNGLTIMVTGLDGSTIKWLEVSGAKGAYRGEPQPCPKPSTNDPGCPIGGTGTNIGAKEDAEDMTVQYVETHHADNVGIQGGANVYDSEIYENALDQNFSGYSSAGMKQNEESEVGRNFVHDNHANGLWCDANCHHRATTNGWHVFDNVTVDNWQYGIRYEHSPAGLDPGVHTANPTALIEGNQIAHNGAAGGSNVDTQNAVWKNNTFGPQTIGGVSYGNNRYEHPDLAPSAIFNKDSGRPERTDLWNIDIFNNDLNGEILVGCDLPDEVVDCYSNEAQAVTVAAGDDLAATLASNPAGTYYFLAGDTTYDVSQTPRLEDGDKLIGEPGEIVGKEPASYGIPTTKIVGHGLTQVLSASGSDATIKWLDISGGEARFESDGSIVEGTGVGLSAGNGGDLVLQYNKFHNNDTLGVGGGRGRIINNEFTDNTDPTNEAGDGWNAASTMCRSECEFAYNYLHDEFANGVWCTVGCIDLDNNAPDDFWVHDNYCERMGRSCYRLEISPDCKDDGTPGGCGPGVHLPEPTTLIENNVADTTGLRAQHSAVMIRDAQNAIVRGNTILNSNSGAVRASDSGKDYRTDIWNIDIYGNTLNGEKLVGCDLPDDVVDCYDNTQ